MICRVLVTILLIPDHGIAAVLSRFSKLSDCK